MNVLFIYPNINGDHEDTYAFGLASIVSITKSSGHDAKVIIVKMEQDYSKVIECISAYKPHVIGFTSVSSQFNFVKEMAAQIKEESPDTIVVCGGVHPTINPECVLESEFLDGVFVGESDNSFIEFLENIENNGFYKNTDNLAYVKNGNLVINKLKPLVGDLDSLPYPDRETYPFEDTLNAVGYAPFLFSRGCPYLCSYCSNHAIAKTYNLHRNTPRYRSAESSIREIEMVLSKFNLKVVMIQDDIFGLDKKWRIEFLKKYQERIGIKFQCLLRVNFIDEEFIRQLKDAGCYRISIGVESGNEYVRSEIMNRQMSNEEIINAFDLVHKYGLQTNAINIIGVPGESEEMLWDTIKLNRKLKPTDSGVNIFYPYKGTKLGDYCFEKGLVDEASYYSFSHERRKTILNYPEDYRKRLSYYRDNWELLVYPFNIKRRLIFWAKKSFVWNQLSKLKRHIFGRLR